jgi:hypothetical protein
VKSSSKRIRPEPDPLTGQGLGVWNELRGENKFCSHETSGVQVVLVFISGTLEAKAIPVMTAFLAQARHGNPTPKAIYLPFLLSPAL